LDNEIRLAIGILIILYIVHKNRK